MDTFGASFQIDLKVRRAPRLASPRLHGPPRLPLSHTSEAVVAHVWLPPQYFVEHVAPHLGFTAKGDEEAQKKQDAGGAHGFITPAASGDVRRACVPACT